MGVANFVHVLRRQDRGAARYLDCRKRMDLLVSIMKDHYGRMRDLFRTVGVQGEGNSKWSIQMPT